MHKDLLIGTYHPEDVVIIDHRFASSKEQVSPVVQRHVEDREQVSLKYILEIDQQVPAADQVKFTKRRILKNIVLREHDHLADLVADDIAVSLAAEIAAQARHAHILADVVAVDASACHSNRIRVQIRGKDLHISSHAELIHYFREQDRNGIGFLTCGAARHPDTKLVCRRRVFDQVVDHPVFEHFKIVRIPEETGHADQDFLGQKPRLVRVVGQILHVFLKVPVMSDHNTPFYAAQDRSLFVIRIIDICDIAKDREYLHHQVAVAQLQPVACIHRGSRDVSHLSRDAVRRQDHVHKTGGDGVSRHTVKFGALRRLHDDNAVFVFYRADPVCAV